MALASEANPSKQLADYIKAQEQKSLLRFITCGSVDDGKSTLIGRLLYDTNLLFDDQISQLQRDTKRHGTVNGPLDFALLVDGLEAERQQGITIDVAYRFFSTDARKFIVADAPGHEQYTCNMVTAASSADVAVILIDAQKGLLEQTRRHSFIVSLLGIKRVAVAINKIDLVKYSPEVFKRITADFNDLSAKLDFKEIHTIPISARFGDNVCDRSSQTPWYEGPTFLEFLETVDVQSGAESEPFRFPVQYVNRPNADFRGFSGTIAAGCVKSGDMVAAAKSGKSAKIKRIVTYDGDLDEAVYGQSITLVLDRDLELSRGDFLVAQDHPAEVVDQFQAKLVCFDQEGLFSGRQYILRTEPTR